MMDQELETKHFGDTMDGIDCLPACYFPWHTMEKPWPKSQVKWIISNFYRMLSLCANLVEDEGMVLGDGFAKVGEERKGLWM